MIAVAVLVIVCAVVAMPVTQRLFSRIFDAAARPEPHDLVARYAERGLRARTLTESDEATILDLLASRSASTTDPESDGNRT